MMIFTFLYHRIDQEKYSNSKAMIEDHLLYLKNKYKIIIPGEKADIFRVNVCLSFDDAYFDFYHYVFPLLKKLNIKVVLGVPVKYIQNSTNLTPQTRLSVSPKLIFSEKILIEKVPFCTWEELKEMSQSGYVHIASHSYNHNDMTSYDCDYLRELCQSKKILEEKIGGAVSTFIYPLGKFNKDIHKLTKKYYKYSMRIGSTFNLSWQNITKIIYRIDSDNLKSVNDRLKVSDLLSYIWFYLLNTFRGR